MVDLVKTLPRMDGQVIMVTGAAGQIGQTLINSIVQLGGKVLGMDVSLKHLDDVAQELNWNSDDVCLVEADVRERNQVESAFSKGIDEFGVITGQINNAAVSVFSPWLDRTDDDFDWVTQVNMKGVFHCMRSFMKNCIDTDQKGAIVNVSSHYGLISPDPRIYTDCARRNSEVYGATKAGVIQMTRYFSVNAIADGAKVRVNAVAPGGVRNPWNPQGDDFQRLYSERCPMGRMAELEEIVGPVLFLLSPAASYVNGHTIVVDGGMTAW